MTVFSFPRHQLHNRRECKKEDCFLCEGRLSLCKVCGGAEGSMPTDCPGYLMREVVATGVQFGELDYQWKRGWIQEDRWTQSRPRVIPTGRRPEPA